MASGASSVLKIIIEGDASGAQGAIDSVGRSLADAGRAWAAFEGLGFLRGVTEDAAGLIESQNAVDQVFKSSAAGVREFGKESAQALGQSEQVANQATATFGNLFTAFGLGQDTAAEWSQTLVSLASDYAAFKNVDVSETLTSFQAIMAGEIEPARRLGIDLREATLQAKAMEMGLIGPGEKLDALTKLQATYAQVLEDSSTVVGQFKREQGGLLGQQMTATAEWENAKAELGMNFIPVMTKATSITGDAASAFGNLDSAQQLSIVSMVAWAAVGGRVVSLLGRLGTAAETAAGNWIMNGAFGPRAQAQSVSAMNKTTVGLAAITAGIVSFSATSAVLDRWSSAKAVTADIDELVVALESLARTGEAEGELDAFGTDLDKLGAAFRNLNKDRGDAAGDLAKGLIPVVGPQIAADALTDAEAAKDTIDEIDQALASLAQQDPQRAEAAYGQLVAALVDQGVAVKDIVDNFDDYWSAMDTSALAAENETESVARNTTAHEDQIAAIKRHAEIIERRNTRMQAQQSAEESLADAQDARASALDDLVDAERAAADGSEENTAAAEAEANAAEAVRDAVDAQRDAEQAVADASANVQEKRKDLNKAIKEAAERYEDLQLAARAAGDSERQAALDVRKAQQDLEDILRSPASDLEKEQAREDLRQAESEAAAAAEAARDAEAAAARGPQDDEQVIAAKEALQDAIEGVSEAQERAADAADAVSDAEGRLQDAHRNTQQVAQETAARVVEAKKAAEDATKNVIDKEQELAGAGLNGEAAIRAQQTALREMANDYAPGSPYRTYIEDLIRDLGIVLGGMVGIGGDYGSVDAADRGGPRGQSPGGNIPQDESRDPVRSRRGGPLVVQNVYGTAAQERRHAKRMGEDLADQLAGMLG